MGKLLSVVICTYDRYKLVGQVVEHLLATGGFDPARHEVLVVDNTPPARRQKFAEAGAGVRVEICETVGLSHARNFGIDHSDGELIAFLDDDAFVSPGWCSAVCKTFVADRSLKVAGGKVVPRYETDTLPPWYSDALASYLSCIDWGPSPRFLRRGEWIVGANMIFRRTVFAAHGRFNTALGRKGSASLLSNEETELFERIGISGIYFDPRLLVEHLIPTERLTLEWFRRRVYWQAISDLVSGSVSAADRGVREEYGRVIASLPPQHRNIQLFMFEPRDYPEFARQLRAIYLVAVMLGDGMRAAA